MINVKLFIVIFVITLIICQLIYKVLNKKTDGTLIVDKARDSWTISITTNPEEIKKKKTLRLKVKITD